MDFGLRFSAAHRFLPAQGGVHVHSVRHLEMVWGLGRATQSWSTRVAHRAGCSESSHWLDFGVLDSSESMGDGHFLGLFQHMGLQSFK